jgi:REP element-mobilizing transposase RayT
MIGGARMAYWRLFYHLVWATKGRAALLVPEIEDPLYRALIHKADELRGFVFAANGMPDHAHLVTSIPPSIAPSDFVKHLKGSSSRFVHLEFGVPFDWQAGYGLFTISERNLDQAIDYVRRQKEHHRLGTIVPRLERTSDKDDGPRIVSDTDES